ncbi:unnamed protein product [Nezara viridula]|uniref:Sushi domain-containing protein n=1 Tax=Nezara viridula TaxID=85310 RepID=A0A9P0MRR7_NEZVI|nr:unnamed protein product [Nezara viridula]
MMYLSSVFCYAREKHPVLGGGCPLPQKPNNGDFEVSECIDGDFSSKCRKVPGTIVSQSVILQYQCNPGFELPDNIKYSICYNGVWDPEPSDCLKVCKGLSSNSLDLQCFYNGKEVDCGKPMIQGTKVRTACKDTYDIRDASASFITTECTSDGTWAKELYKCEPGCGKRNLVNTISTLKGDQFLDQYEFPWHAEIYVNDGSDFVSWCGGTIIHQKAILTDIGLKREDIGNALTFPRFDNGIEQHFIYGVVSLLESGIVTITNVTEHMKWIEDKLNEII